MTEPSKWPGVTSLRALLDREKDDETPNLNVLLCETFVAIYLSLLSYALATCDAQILYRLVSQKVTPNYWSHVFGGGAKKMLNYEKTPHPSLAKELSVRSFLQGIYFYYNSIFFSYGLINSDSNNPNTVPVLDVREGEGV